MHQGSSWRTELPHQHSMASVVAANMGREAVENQTRTSQKLPHGTSSLEEQWGKDLTRKRRGNSAFLRGKKH